MLQMATLEIGNIGTGNISTLATFYKSVIFRIVICDNKKPAPGYGEDLER